MPQDIRMRVAQIVPSTEAEGPGKRFAIWFQGCPLRCPGCCNPEFLSFRGGEEKSLEDVVDAMTSQVGIEGITLLGGEPFAHAEAAAALARSAKRIGLSVMVFSGYLLEDLRMKPDATAALLAQIDILVDGPFECDLPDLKRRWIGSTNQRIHFLTDRYRTDDPCWHRSNTLEIRVDSESIRINGFPALQALGLWKGWKRPKSAEGPKR